MIFLWGPTKFIYCFTSLYWLWNIFHSREICLTSCNDNECLQFLTNIVSCLNDKIYKTSLIEGFMNNITTLFFIYQILSSLETILNFGGSLLIATKNYSFFFFFFFGLMPTRSSVLLDDKNKRTFWKQHTATAGNQWTIIKYDSGRT